MNCEQLAAYDEELTSKDAQIAELHARLSALPPTRPLDPTVGAFVPALSLTTMSPRECPVAQTRGKRQGKAPPVDSFSGESAELRFEDWLPSLERASTWNDWSEQEKLIQLAGHFRVKACNLFPEEDKSTFSKAVARMKDVLGPGSRVMAAQDFRHTLQEENESVSNYI